MGTGTAVIKGEKITADKINLKLESVAENPEEKVTERQLDVTYQNTDPTRSLLILINTDILISSYGYAKIDLQAGISDPPTDRVMSAGFQDNFTGFINLFCPTFIIVKPGEFYRAYSSIDGDGSIGLSGWIETYL